MQNEGKNKHNAEPFVHAMKAARADVKEESDPRNQGYQKQASDEGGSIAKEGRLHSKIPCRNGDSAGGPVLWHMPMKRRLDRNPSMISGQPRRNFLNILFGNKALGSQSDLEVGAGAAALGINDRELAEAFAQLGQDDLT